MPNHRREGVYIWYGNILSNVLLSCYVCTVISMTRKCKQEEPQSRRFIPREIYRCITLFHVWPKFGFGYWFLVIGGAALQRSDSPGIQACHSIHVRYRSPCSISLFVRHGITLIWCKDFPNLIFVRRSPVVVWLVIRKMAIRILFYTSGPTGWSYGLLYFTSAT